MRQSITNIRCRLLDGQKNPHEKHCPFMIRKFVPPAEVEGRDFAICRSWVMQNVHRCFTTPTGLLATGHPYMDVVEVLEDAQGYQTAMILKKRHADERRGRSTD